MHSGGGPAAHHKHADDHSGERRLLWALTLTGGFMLAEFVGGLLSGSLALIADAGHMLTDTVALFLAWAASRIARRPADKLRSYGYHRVQILAAFSNGMLFIAIVAWIVFEAIRRLFQPHEVLGGPMLVIAVLGLAVNIVAFALLHGGHSHSHANLNLRAAALHVLGDILGSVAAISAAGIILVTGWTPADPLLSLLVAALILRSAWMVVRESAHILLEGAPADMDAQDLSRALIDSVEAVHGVHHIHLWSLTPERPLLSLHVNVAPDCDATEVLQQIKRVLVARFGIEHSTVQLEPDHCVDEHGAPPVS